MEHPYLFFVKLFELVGLGHFAHAYPHVVYSWVIMIVLIVLFFLATKGLSLVPSKGQNVIELVVSGIEDFMIGVVGEEGRWLLPLAASVFIYIFACNLSGLIQAFSAYSEHQHHPLMCAGCRGVHARYRHQVSWCQIYQAFFGTRMVVGAINFHHRAHRPCRPCIITDFPAFRKHGRA